MENEEGEISEIDKERQSEKEGEWKKERERMFKNNETDRKREQSIALLAFLLIMMESASSRSRLYYELDAAVTNFHY